MTTEQECRIMVLLLRSYPPGGLRGQLDTSQASIFLQQQHSSLVLVPSRLCSLPLSKLTAPGCWDARLLGGVCPASQSALLPQTNRPSKRVVSQQHACPVARSAQSRPGGRRQGRVGA